MNRNFNAFTDLKSLELEVPMICLATGCVSLRGASRYVGTDVRYIHTYTERSLCKRDFSPLMVFRLLKKGFLFLRNLVIYTIFRFAFVLFVVFLPSLIL